MSNCETFSNNASECPCAWNTSAERRRARRRSGERGNITGTSSAWRSDRELEPGSSSTGGSFAGRAGWAARSATCPLTLPGPCAHADVRVAGRCFARPGYSQKPRAQTRGNRERLGRAWPLATLAELHAAYLQGDAVANAVVEEWAACFVRGLIGVIWNFDPEFILLTGPVVSQCPSLAEAAKRIIGGLKGNARSFDVPLILESHHAGTGVVAASATVATRYLEELASGEPSRNRLLAAQ